MGTVRRSDFEAELLRLGYRPPESYDMDRCTHRSLPSLAVFMMLNIVCHEGARTYGELGWEVYTGCEECCRGMVSSLCCGGHFEHARVFAGELDVTAEWDLSVGEIAAAGVPLPVDDEGEEED
ncbi:MAG: hypothetical protein JNK56_22565 [Myxococcales bacterium]|nr:hypothetical protein [Myxococcales bacterium]